MPASQPHPEPAEPSAVIKPLALVAEDNKLNQILATDRLKKLGYDVRVVDGGIDAVMACMHQSFAVVLMDIMMPDMDGFRATDEIRAREKAQGTRRTPIIGLSARAMDGDREQALAAGLDDYLTKPLQAAELEAALVRWVGGPLAVDHG